MLKKWADIPLEVREAYLTGSVASMKRLLQLLKAIM